MANILLNLNHLKEYVKYGTIAGLFHLLMVWYFLYRSNYNTSVVLFIGSVFFMFVIMIYALKLTKRRPDQYSTWLMIIMGQVTVVIGIVVSVIGSIILCCFYVPEFVNGAGSDNFLLNAPGSVNVKNSGTLEFIFLTAIFVNYMAGAFISAMIAYAVKPNQTEDQTPTIFEEPAQQRNL